MDTLFSLKVFREVVELGSFTKAAEKLHISNAMASKHVSHLENRIGSKLLQRNSRNLHLTESGQHYYQHCTHALDTLQQAAEEAAAGTATPQGTLTVTMPVWFAGAIMSRWMVEYRCTYPKVTLNLMLSNQKTDLISDGIDLALRVSHNPHPSLIVKPLADIRFAIVAAPAYLRRTSVPNTLQDLHSHDAVLPSYTDLSTLTATNPDGHTESVPLYPCIHSDNTLMTHQLVNAGAGIGYLPIWIVAQDLQAGRLVHLLKHYRLPETKLYAAYADHRFLTAKVRSFIDFLETKIHHLESTPY